MATIGQQLTSPESGWKRFDINPTQTEFSTYGNWTYIGNDTYSSYNKTRAFGQSPNGYRFNFVGSKLRIIAGTYSSRSKNIKVYIDGELRGTYSGNGTERYQILLYEISGLLYREHYVDISCSEAYSDYDAIDIDENGELKPYNDKFFKFLIKQNNQYYTIKSEFYPVGQDTLTKEIVDKYGSDSLTNFTNTFSTNSMLMTNGGVLGTGQQFSVDLNSEMLSLNNAIIE